MQCILLWIISFCDNAVLASALTVLAFSVTVAFMKIKRWTIFDTETREYIQQRFILRSSAEKVRDELISARAFVRAIHRLNDQIEQEYTIPVTETFQLIELQ